MTQGRIGAAGGDADGAACPKQGGREEPMYYVFYTGAGKEDRAEAFIRKRVCSGLCSSCFHPVRRMRKKIRGEWKEYEERLVPGYIFLESGDIGGLYLELQKSPRYLKALGKEEADPGDLEMGVRFHALTEDEVGWLEKLAGKRKKPGTASGAAQNPVVGLSQVGFGEDDRVAILSGPLKDMGGMVKKINLHKRTAEVEVELMGRKLSLHLGIEILGGKKGPEADRDPCLGFGNVPISVLGGSSGHAVGKPGEK